MSQSKKWSLVETLTNTAVGFVVSLLSQLVIFAFYDIKLSFFDNVMMTVYFTFISIARGYLLRRWFNSMKKGRG